MAVLLFLLSLLSGFLAVVGMIAAKGAIQEAVAACFFIVSAVFMTGSFVVVALNGAAKDIIRALEPRPVPAPTAHTPGAEPVLRDVVP